MKKLDEIMELMADEMQDFQNGLLQMKKMTDELSTRSIPITTEALEKHLTFFLQQQKEKETLRRKVLSEINQKLQEAYILPKSLGIIFGIFLILFISFTGYVSFQWNNANERLERERLVQEEAIELYDRYFTDNPQIKEDYSKWHKNHNLP